MSTLATSTGSGSPGESRPWWLGRVAARLLVAVCLVAGVVATAAEPEMRLSSKKVRDEVRAVVEAQLAALRSGDFGTAYDFAARAIRRQFDERMFELMIKRGYAPLVRPGKTELGVVRDEGERIAQVGVTVTDARNRSTVYRYWLVKEGENWRINGVVLEQRPPRGDT
jgi:hypothetical protein